MQTADIEEVGALLHAESGDLEPLAKYIERGGAIGPETRRFLVAHLRGEIPKRRGLKRTWAQVEREISNAWFVDAVRWRLTEDKAIAAAKSKGARADDELIEAAVEARAKGAPTVSLAAAIAAAAELLGESPETIKTHCRNVRRQRKRLRPDG